MSGRGVGLLRRDSPGEEVRLILRVLPSIDITLRRGAIVVLERHRLRLRDLPITRQREENGKGA